jgi:hypothetical protein
MDLINYDNNGRIILSFFNNSLIFLRHHGTSVPANIDPRSKAIIRLPSKKSELSLLELTELPSATAVLPTPAHH